MVLFNSLFLHTRSNGWFAKNWMHRIYADINPVYDYKLARTFSRPPRKRRPAEMSFAGQEIAPNRKIWACILNAPRTFYELAAKPGLGQDDPGGRCLRERLLVGAGPGEDHPGWGARTEARWPPPRCKPSPECQRTIVLSTRRIEAWCASNKEADNLFTLFDSYRDGICCTKGWGSYILVFVNGREIAQGGEFGSDKDWVHTFQS